jgi:hypothetical protein
MDACREENEIENNSVIFIFLVGKYVMRCLMRKLSVFVLNNVMGFVILVGIYLLM